MLECCTFVQILYFTVMENDWKKHLNEQPRNFKKNKTREHKGSPFFLLTITGWSAFLYSIRIFI